MFLSCVVLGSVWEGEAVWELVDLCNALMAIPNLTALLLLSPQAVSYTHLTLPTTSRV